MGQFFNLIEISDYEIGLYINKNKTSPYHYNENNKGEFRFIQLCFLVSLLMQGMAYL